MAVKPNPAIQVKNLNTAIKRLSPLERLAWLKTFFEDYYPQDLTAGALVEGIEILEAKERKAAAIPDPKTHRIGDTDFTTAGIIELAQGYDETITSIYSALQVLFEQGFTIESLESVTTSV